MTILDIYRVPAAVVQDCADHNDVIAAIGAGDAELLCGIDRYEEYTQLCTSTFLVNTACTSFVAEQGDLIVAIWNLQPGICLTNSYNVQRFEVSYQGPSTAEARDL